MTGMHCIVPLQFDMYSYIFMFLSIFLKPRQYNYVTLSIRHTTLNRYER